MRWPLYLGLKVKLILLTVVLMLGLSAKSANLRIVRYLADKSISPKTKDMERGQDNHNKTVYPPALWA